MSSVSTARREALAAMSVWLAALVWSVGYCYRFGYDRDPAALEFYWGFPDWVFWGIVVPWFVCWGISAWFAFVFIQDVPLGDDPGEEPATEPAPEAACD